MPKIDIKTSLISSYEKTKYTGKAIKDNSKKTISYYEKDNTKVVFNYQKNELSRENKEMKMKFSFKDKTSTEGIILIKELNKKLVVEIKTKSIIIKDNYIDIKYSIESDDFDYKIELEEV